MRAFLAAILALASPGIAPYEAFAQGVSRGAKSGASARLTPSISLQSPNLGGLGRLSPVQLGPSDLGKLSPAQISLPTSASAPAPLSNGAPSAVPAGPAAIGGAPVQSTPGALPGANESAASPIASNGSIKGTSSLPPASGAAEAGTLGELSEMSAPKKSDDPPASARFDGAKPRGGDASGAAPSGKAASRPRDASEESAITTMARQTLSDLIPEAAPKFEIKTESRDGLRRVRIIEIERPVEDAKKPAPEEKESKWDRSKKYILAVGFATVLAALGAEIAGGDLGASLSAGYHGWKTMLWYVFVPYVALSLFLVKRGLLTLDAMRNQMFLKILRLMLYAPGREMFWFYGPRMAAVVSFEELLFRAIAFGGFLAALAWLPAVIGSAASAVAVTALAIALMRWMKTPAAFSLILLPAAMALLVLFQVPFAVAVAAVASAALFSAIHIPVWGFHWLTFLLRMALGLVLTFIYIASGSLLAALFAHFLFNTVQLVVVTAFLRSYRSSIQPFSEFENAFYEFYKTPRRTLLWTLLHPREYFAEIRRFRDALMKNGELTRPEPQPAAAAAPASDEPAR